MLPFRSPQLDSPSVTIPRGNSSNGDRNLKTLGVANGKGGVGKTTTAVTLAALASEQYRTLLVDADETRSAVEWSERAGDSARYQVAEAAGDPDSLGRIRSVKGFDLAIIDLPGAKRTGELAALLRPPKARRPAVDGLVLPTEAGALDLRVLVRTVREEVEPARVPFVVLITKVGGHPATLARVADLASEMRAVGIPVLASPVRRLSAHQEAANRGVSITELAGRAARVAEAEYRAVAGAVFGDLLGMDWRAEVYG